MQEIAKFFDVNKAWIVPLLGLAAAILGYLKYKAIERTKGSMTIQSEITAGGDVVGRDKHTK